MSKRKFKVTCKESGCGSIELIAEVEDSSNCEQEAANALCRKLEQHFKDKHPKEKRDEGHIAVNQGDKWATLQSDGTIKELASINAFNDSGSYWACEKCGKYLIFFVDGSRESHNCSKKNTSPRTPNNPSNNNNSPSQNQPSNNNNSPSQNQPNNQNSNSFNWKSPLVIGGGIALVLAAIGIAAWLFTRNKNKDRES